MVHLGLIDNISAFGQVMALCQAGQQGITWTNVDQNIWFLMASLGQNKLRKKTRPSAF